MLGSHIDSVPQGGNYDGDVGVIGAIEVAQLLHENDVARAIRSRSSALQTRKAALSGAVR